jgi:hypothetical protein
MVAAQIARERLWTVSVDIEVGRGAGFIGAPFSGRPNSLFLTFSVSFLCGFALCCGGGESTKEGRCGRTTDAGDRICCGSASELPGLSCIDLSLDGGEYGIYGHCITSGQSFDAKIVGARCCAGLMRVEADVETSAVEPGYPEGCAPGPLPPSSKLCLPCGNGTCDERENRCNCPTDCM